MRTRTGHEMSRSACSFFFAVAVVLLSACVAPESDRALIARFREHRQEFETLRQMSERDEIRGGLEPNAGSWSRLPEPRREKFERLFDQLNLEHGLERNALGEVRFPISYVGLVTSGYCKGIVYSPAPLAPTFDDLDDAKTDSRLLSARGGYRPIDGHWYVFLER